MEGADIIRFQVNGLVKVLDSFRVAFQLAVGKASVMIGFEMTGI